MTNYDKLREKLSCALDEHLFTDDVLKAITAAGIPIEALSNGEMVAVPKEPTDAMCAAGWVARHRSSPIAEMEANIYKAMIAAAPKEPADG